MPGLEIISTGLLLSVCGGFLVFVFFFWGGGICTQVSVIKQKGLSVLGSSHTLNSS